MKKVKLAIFTMIMSINSYGQNNVWAIPNNNDFSGYIDWETEDVILFPQTDPIDNNPYNNPETGYSPELNIENPTILNNLHKGAANAIKGTNGELLFFIVGNSIFDKFGRTIHIQDDNSGYSNPVGSGYNEIAVVPDPSNCNRFYLLSEFSDNNLDINNGFVDNRPAYAILDVSLINNNNQFNTNAQGRLVNFDGTSNVSGFQRLLPELNLAKHTDFKGNLLKYAVGSLNPIDNSRTIIIHAHIKDNSQATANVGNAFVKFKITPNGFQSFDYIQFALNVDPNNNNAIKINSNYFNGNNEKTNFRTELEIFENVDGTFNIAYATTRILCTFKLDQNLDYITESLKFIPTSDRCVVSGMEFSPNGRYIYFTHEYTSNLEYVLDCWDTYSNEFVTLPNWIKDVDKEHRFSFIEINNERLFMANERYLAAIFNPNNPTQSSYNGQYMKIPYTANHWEFTQDELFSGSGDEEDIFFKRYTLPDQIDQENYSGTGPLQVELPTIPYGCNGVFQPICVINGHSSYNYEWTTTSGQILATTECFTPQSAGNYILVVTTRNGCRQKMKFSVKNERLPFIFDLRDYQLCLLTERDFTNASNNVYGWPNDPFSNFSQNVDYHWAFNGNPLTIIDNSIPPYQINFMGAGTYTVEISTPCASSSIVRSFTVSNNVTYVGPTNLAFIDIVEGQDPGTITLSNDNFTNFDHNWTITDLTTGTVQTFTGNLINLPYIPGHNYDFHLEILSRGRACKIYFYNSNWRSDSKRQKNNELTVFPNPTNGNTSVKINNFNPSINYQLSVYDSFGSVVYAQTLNKAQTSLNLSDLDNGLYYISVFDGEKNINTKIIVNK